MIDDKRFYGIYLGICVDVEDDEKDNRIRLQVPQVLGQSETGWARACLPVTSNSNHPDHKKHLASEVAALLQAHADHSVSGTTGGATVSTFGCHTH
ncbi:MAG: phage baseplate assembly protein V, partial [bacterium]